MHIDRNQLICGVSARLLRDALPNIESIFFPQNIGIKMGLTRIKSEVLAQLLENEGYIEQDKDSGFDGYYHLTIKGGALRLANAAKPIRRKTAETAVKDFLSRVEDVNSNKKYLCETGDIIVFGSFLSEKNLLTMLIWLLICILKINTMTKY